MKKGSFSRAGAADSSGFSSGNKQGPTKITREISGGQSGLRHSLRGSGKVWKKTVLGKKYEISEKLKEKKNYIMYHSGMGHEKNVIEEIEQIPQPKKEKIIEERQIIDNYEYHETKNLKKKKDPRRLSVTVHQRLSSPFERTVLKKYSSSTTKEQPRSYTTSTTTIQKTNYGGVKDSISKYNSFTTKQDKNKSVTPSKLYETYKPSKNTSSYTQTKTTKTIQSQSKAPVKTTINQYQMKTITSTEKSQTINNKYRDRRGNAPKYVAKFDQKNKYNRPETEKNYVGEEQTKTETTQDGDYLIKVTTTKKKVSEMKPYGGRRHGGYPGPKPKKENMPKGGKKPIIGVKRGEDEEEKLSSSNRPSYGGSRPGFGRPHGPHGFGGPHEPRPGFGEPRGPFGGPRNEDKDNRPSSSERPKSFERPRPSTGTKPGEGPRPTLEGPNEPGFGSKGSGRRPGFGPGPRPGFEPGPRPGFEPGPRSGFGPGPRPGFGPGPRPVLPPRPGFGPHGAGFGPYGPEFGPGGFGPRPVLPPRPGFYDDGIIHYHLPTCPLYEEERRRAQSLKASMRSFEERTFSQSAHRPYIGGNYGRYSSESKLGKSSMEKRNMTITTQKKNSNIGGVSQIRFQTTTTSDGGDNYNYYESKNILKKHRKLPITIHHRRGQIGAYTDDIPDRPHHRAGSYTKTKITTNLNNNYSSGNIVKNLNKQKMAINLKNKYSSSSSNIVKNLNRPKITIGSAGQKGGSKYTQKSSYKQVKTSSGKSTSGFTKGTGKGLSTTYSEYKKYEQKGKIGSSSSVGNLSKYQFKKNTDYSSSKMGASSGETSYKYTSNEYRQGGPSYGDYDEQYKYTESNEYSYGGNNLGGFSQYQYLNDNEFEVIECPVHGRQTVRRNRYYNYY